MKQLPILFSNMMVQALLAGCKTMTRRIVKERISFEAGDESRRDLDAYGVLDKRGNYIVDEDETPVTLRAFARWLPGDILYVRESHYAYGKWVKDGISKKTGKQKWKFVETGNHIEFEGSVISMSVTYKSMDKESPSREHWYKRNSLFMPKDAARIWLQVEDVRVERAQEISESDAINEGVINIGDEFIFKQFPQYHEDYNIWLLRKNDGIVERPPMGPSPYQKFKALWIMINGAESWNSNPWVWVISFKVLSTTGKPANL